MFPVKVVPVILFWCLYRNVTSVNRSNNIRNLALLRETFNFPAFFRPCKTKLYEVILQTANCFYKLMTARNHGRFCQSDHQSTWAIALTSRQAPQAHSHSLFNRNSVTHSSVLSHYCWPYQPTDIYSKVARDTRKFSFHQWSRALLFKSSWNQFWGRGNIQARLGRLATCRRRFLKNKYSIWSDCRNRTRRRLLRIRLRTKFWIAKSTGYCRIRSRRTTVRRPYVSQFAMSMMH